jgi:hypothetical protein
VLAARGVPFLFASGYGSAGVQSPHVDRVVVRKPFELEDLREASPRSPDPRPHSASGGLPWPRAKNPV